MNYDCNISKLKILQFFSFINCHSFDEIDAHPPVVIWILLRFGIQLEPADTKESEVGKKKTFKSERYSRNYKVFILPLHHPPSPPSGGGVWRNS